MRHKLRLLAGIFLLFALIATVQAKREAKPVKLSEPGRINLGMAYNHLRNDNLAKAFERVTIAATSDPNSADVQTLLAMIQNRRGNQGPAADAFKRALKLAPGNSNVLNAYGAWLCQQGSSVDADQYFQKALNDPGILAPRDVLYNAGRCASKANDLNKAEQYLRRALELFPNDGATLLQLAEVKHAQEQDFVARAFLQRREALGPMGPEAYELAVKIETGAGDSKSAERYRTQLREKFPDHQSPTREGAGRP